MLNVQILRTQICVTYDYAKADYVE